MVDFSDLLGVPYKHHGRSLSGMDCYGFVIEIERRLGRQVFDFDYAFRDYRDKESYEVWQQSMKRWEETAVLKDGDVLLFFDGKGRVVHAAVSLGGRRIAHCDLKGVKVASLDGFYWQNWKAYRWRQ